MSLKYEPAWCAPALHEHAVVRHKALRVVCPMRGILAAGGSFL